MLQQLHNKLKLQKPSKPLSLMLKIITKFPLHSLLLLKVKLHKKLKKYSNL